jgi:hypothetical protein
MKIHFCDLCNESVPQSDLDEGRAFMRKGRVICAKCDTIMSGRGADETATQKDPDTKIDLASKTAVAPGAASAKTLGTGEGERVRGPMQYRVEGGGGLIAGFLSAVAVVLVAVVAVMLMDRVESVSTGLDDDVAAVQREVSAAEEGLAERIEAMNAVSLQSAKNLDTRFDALLASRDKRDAETATRLDKLGTNIAELAERLGSLTETERSVSDQARSIVALEAGLGSLRLDIAQVAADLAARPIVVAEPAAPEPTGPLWLPLVDDLASANSGVRWNAVEDLGHTGDPAVVPHLIPVLDDEDTFVRMAAARVLGDLGGDVAVAPLIDTLSDPAESVRDAAVSSLRQITGQNFRFDPLGKQADRTKRIRAWRDWWEKQNKA